MPALENDSLKQGESLIQALTGYAVSRVLREDTHFVLLRARREADRIPVLLLGARDGRRASRERLEREYALRAELDPAWAAQPLALAGAGAVLVLADSGADPLAPVAGAPLATERFLELGAAIATALGQLHRQDLVHQDLRPEHILLARAGGKVSLTGFGIAARAAGTCSDLYALGVLLYQLLCGRPPFAAGAAQAVPAPRACYPAVDPACAAIVMKLLEQSGGRRYQGTAELLADLRQCSGAPAAGRAPGIGARQFSDNVIELMVARLRQLPWNTLELVKLLACLGQHASVATLAQVAGMSTPETDECLWPAARLGLVKREPHAYRFMHDRVQEAAYSLIAHDSLPERHLHIGRTLCDALQADAPQELVFAVAGHLNRARAAIHDPAELRRLAALNAQADERARIRVELAQAALTQIALHQVAGRFDQAVAVALEALALFGVRFPDAPDAIAAAFQDERAAIALNLAGRAPADLLHQAPSLDRDTVIVAALLAEMGSSVFSARPDLYALLAAKALNFALRFGATATSAITYSRYAILLVALGALDEAFAFSELALALAARGGKRAGRSGRLLFVHGAYIDCWRHPLAASVALLEQAFDACRRAGDLPHAGYAAHNATWHSFEAGATLDQVRQRARRYQDFARRHDNAVLVQLLRSYEQLTLCLQGAGENSCGGGGDVFCARESLALMERAGFGAARARCHLLRQVAAFTFGRHGEALQAAEAAALDQQFFLASVTEVTRDFYHALTLAALHAGEAPARQAVSMRVLLEKQARLQAWAAHCPVNFDNRYLLVTAEIARLDGREQAAMRAYDAALASAAAGGFVHHEALAAELAARFHRARGVDAMALRYARGALQAYERWGAHAKVRALEREFAALLG